MDDQKAASSPVGPLPDYRPGQFGMPRLEILIKSKFAALVAFGDSCQGPPTVPVSNSGLQGCPWAIGQRSILAGPFPTNCNRANR